MLTGSRRRPVAVVAIAVAALALLTVVPDRHPAEAAPGSPAVTPPLGSTNVHSGLCLDVDQAATANGSRLILWTCNTQANQKWART